MRFGKRRRHRSLSACCVTDQSPEQTRAVLANLRGVADEIVIGVDPSRANELAAFERMSDRAFVTEHGPLERNIAAVHEACTQPWVFRIDTDEIASPSLIRRLPELIAHPTARQYAFTRRWLTADGDHWIDERPWWPDWQVRLVRRETAVFLPEVHVPVELDAPRLFVTEPIYHATVALLSPRERRRKMLEYEIVLRGGPGTLREPNAVIYEPERHTTRPPVAVPAEDAAAIQTLVGVTASRPSTSSSPSIALPQPEPVDGAAGPIATTALDPEAEVEIELLEHDLQFRAREARTLIVKATNRSGERWENGAHLGDRGHVASYHWISAGGSIEEGVRTLLPGPVDPGGSVVLPLQVVGPAEQGPAELAVSVVDEHVRWLKGDLTIPATVAPALLLPDRREIRPAEGSPIPRIIHRVWLGDAPMPPDYEAFGASWAQHHPDWEVRLWTDADAPRPDGVDRARNFAERADLVRYELLRRHGGVYVDTDVECLRSIDPLLEGVEAFAAYEVPGRLCNAVIGATAGHPAIADLVGLASLVAGHGDYPHSLATTFTTYVLESWPQVTLFNPTRFYPELWDGTVNQGAEAPYARHLWGQSWVTADADSLPAVGPCGSVAPTVNLTTTVTTPIPRVS